MEILSIILLLILLIVVIIVLLKLSSLVNRQKNTDDTSAKLDYMEKSLQRFEMAVKDDFRQNRDELANNLSKFQQSFLDTLREISFNQLEQLKTMNDQNQQNLSSLNKTIEERLNRLIEKNDVNAKENRDELSRHLILMNDQLKIRSDEQAAKQKEQNDQTRLQLELIQSKLDEKLSILGDNLQRNANQSRESLDKSLKDFQIVFTENVKAFNDLQIIKFADLEKKQGELIITTELKLEKMRETVDEKLQKTLETRLGQSFELVSKQLESVQKGLGEMQSLAADVGGLKRVLSNVKTRGVMGEIQLGNILEQILAPEQYETNVKTKRSSSDHVEYAIKLPGRDDNNQPVYLPIDAKFPQEAYHLLQIAYDEANAAKAEEANRTLAASIRKFAKDIRDKYIDPPYTTDFAIMFLPIEGLYAEVVRNTDLIEQLQREFKVIVTGPTTLAAILNSLQMGFKTLAIQKRSSEVWEILGAVKTEFGKFGGILEKAQKKISEASNDIDTLVGARARAINRKLQNVTELPSKESGLLLGEALIENDIDEES